MVLSRENLHVARKSIFMIASPERGDSPRGGEMHAGQREPLSTRGTAAKNSRPESERLLLLWQYRTKIVWYCLRARVHRRLSTSFRQILLHTALKILAIRKYACKFLPCLQKNLLENPHIFPTNTSSYVSCKCFRRINMPCPTAPCALPACRSRHTCPRCASAPAECSGNLRR